MKTSGRTFSVREHFRKRTIKVMGNFWKETEYFEVLLEEMRTLWSNSGREFYI